MASSPVVVSFIVPISENLGERPMLWVHRCFCEQEDVRLVEVKNSDEAIRRRAIVSSFLGVACEDRDIRCGWGHRWVEGVVFGS